MMQHDMKVWFLRVSYQCNIYHLSKAKPKSCTNVLRAEQTNGIVCSSVNQADFDKFQLEQRIFSLSKDHLSGDRTLQVTRQGPIRSFVEIDRSPCHEERLSVLALVHISCSYIETVYSHQFSSRNHDLFIDTREWHRCYAWWHLCGVQLLCYIEELQF